MKGLEFEAIFNRAPTIEVLREGGKAAKYGMVQALTQEALKTIFYPVPENSSLGIYSLSWWRFF
jgi:hypothetical protein